MTSPSEAPSALRAEGASRICGLDGCGEHFKPVVPHQIYCCKSCQVKARHGRLRPGVRVQTVICREKTCANVFEWSSKTSNQLYCCRGCMLKARRRRLRQRPRSLPTEVTLAKKRAAAFRRYGITPEEFDELVERQDSRCAICRKVATLVPDHCHAGGGFRGAICTPCNHMLGKAYDDPEVLERAAEYLRNGR